jgi:YD repeat-containing protein
MNICTPAPLSQRGGNCPDCGTNPVNISTGAKFQREVLYTAPTSSGLSIQLAYNSKLVSDPFGDTFPGNFGTRWNDSYNRQIVVPNSANNDGWFGMQRPDGKIHTFKSAGDHATFTPESGDLNDRLTWNTINTTTPAIQFSYYVSADDSIEDYSAGGQLVRIRHKDGRILTFTYSDRNTPTTVSVRVGSLITVTDHFGRSLNYSYDGNGRVVKITDPAGGEYLFTYTGDDLTAVTLPGGVTRQYLYNESAQTGGQNLPGALTGLIDERGNRYATWTYDAAGRATSSQHAGGVNQVSLSYSATSGTTTFTDALGTTRNFSFNRVQQNLFPAGFQDSSTGQAAPCAGCGGVASYTYDANGNVASKLDFNGNLTCYAYDTARNLETKRIEGLPSGANCSSLLTGTPTLTGAARMITTQWSTDWRRPTVVAEPLRITTYTYGAANDSNPGNRGNVLTRTVQATSDTIGTAGTGATSVGSPRTWTYTYNAYGFVLTANGPRADVSDVTTYTYYADNDADLGKRGNVATVTNALGHTTQITSYNAHGQPLTVVNPNGLTTTLVYDSRLRVTSRTVGSEVTGYTYDGAGLLTQVTLPDSSTLTYTYDDAHRLTALQDNLGNKITYTLDLLGNRTKEDITDPANALAQTRSRVFDAINRLQKDIGAQNQTTQYAYDTQGNLTTVTDPLNRVTTNAYDALNRLASMTQPAPSSGQSQPVIAYGYNGLDQLTQVTDPRNLVTSYAYDGLGNMNTQVSPDTGTTANTYDLAGNILTSTDAKSQVTTYTYDALNRVATVTYNQATGTQLKTVAYTYDQTASGNYGVGRLTTVTETAADGTTVLQTTGYLYDQKGRLTQETRTLAGQSYVTAYAYNATTGQMTGMTYPSGRTLAYSYDALGRISQIATTAPAGQGGQTQTLVSSITYQPFGGVKSYVLGNNRTITRAYDQDGRISSYTLGGTSISVGYDTASRITSLLDNTNAANSNSYGYDNLDRLTSASVPATNYGYSYDLTGNRLTRNSGSATATTTVSPTSNRITQVADSTTRSYSYDNNGSTTNDGNNTYTYDPRGRMVQAQNAAGTTSYQVGANGQRVRKTGAVAGDVVFLYDAQGKLISEATPAGVVKKEYFYLLDLPVAVNVQ